MLSVNVRLRVNYTAQKEHFRLDGNLKSYWTTTQIYFCCDFSWWQSFPGDIKRCTVGVTAVLVMLCDSWCYWKWISVNLLENEPKMFCSLLCSLVVWYFFTPFLNCLCQFVQLGFIVKGLFRLIQILVQVIVCWSQNSATPHVYPLKILVNFASLL